MKIISKFLRDFERNEVNKFQILKHEQPFEEFEQKTFRFNYE